MSQARYANNVVKRRCLVWLSFLYLIVAPATVIANQDILLVLDNSGSMKKNDPQFLARSAVRDFIESLNSETRAGVIIFDQRVTLAVPLTQTDGPNTRLLTNSLDDINYRGQLTDSPAAVERAIYELKTNGRADAAKYIVFLTDGIVDTGNAAADVEKTKWLREELAADAADNGIQVLSVAFTENADFFLIQSLAKKTQGEYYRALTPADLAGVFADMRTRIEDSAKLPAAVPPQAAAQAQTSTSQQTTSEPAVGKTENLASEEPEELEAEPVETKESVATASTLVEGPATQNDIDPDNLLAGISPEDLEALKEISEIEGIPIEQLAKELYGNGEDDSANSGVVISRPGEPSVVVEPDQSGMLVLVIAAAAGLLGLVILVVWFIKRKAKNKNDTDGRDADKNSASPSIQTPAAFLHDMSGLAQEPLVNLDHNPLMVGRVAGAPDEHHKYLVVNAPTVGRRHAVVKYKDKAFWLLDMGSVNGTYVNDNRLSGECQLRHGDRIRFHNAEFEFTQPDVADAGETMIGEVVAGEATIVADAATMMGVAAAASAAGAAEAADDLFADSHEDIDIARDAEADLTLEGSEEQPSSGSGIMPEPIPEHVVVDGETSIDEIFDVTGEDVVPAVLEADNVADETAILDLTSSEAATQMLDVTEMPQAVSDPETTSGEVDNEFDAEASAFFDDITVGPVAENDADPDPTSTTEPTSSSADSEIFSVDGSAASSEDQAALDAKLERARELAENDSPPTESVDFNDMDTMLNMEAPPQEDPNDLTLDDFIETNTFKASNTASPDSVSLDRFVETGKFDSDAAAETMILDESDNGDDASSIDDEDDADDFFNDGSEDPTELK